ncbi:MAG: hypothetical protein BWY66_00573 [bacterium ADurb.Bin374]|nr:MAG: hypothetical protein BWY66_00573 [bacterium ADurb.Bin374]
MSFKSKKCVYIAGKMRGISLYNFPAFDKARDRLKGLGLTPLSPADMDRAEGFDPHEYAGELHVPFAQIDWNIVPRTFNLEAAIERDNAAIDDPDTVAVYVITEGFADSEGATAEVERCMKAGKIILFDTMSDERILRALGMPVTVDDHVAALTREVHAAMGIPERFPEKEEIRYTDPATGGMKGEKLARFDLLPPDILWELAEHYGKGAKKYADRNMEKGYPWSKSFAACQRHLNQFWRGEDNDPEFGSLHLIAAAWHCFTMAWFLRHGAGTDDRPKAEIDKTAAK